MSTPSTQDIHILALFQRNRLLKPAMLVKIVYHTTQKLLPIGWCVHYRVQHKVAMMLIQKVMCIILVSLKGVKSCAA